MAERRITSRQRDLKKAVIESEGAGGATAINCTVWNISKAGARVAVISPPDIPDHFDLVMLGDHSKHACRVIWRKAKQKGTSIWLGVDFQ